MLGLVQFYGVLCEANVHVSIQFTCFVVNKVVQVSITELGLTVAKLCRYLINKLLVRSLTYSKWVTAGLKRTR